MLFIAILVLGFFGTASAQKKMIAVTFDDGPRPWMYPALLDFLREEKIPAAFFVQGWQAKEHPDLIRAIWQERKTLGHTVGSHTYNHEALPAYIKRSGEVAGTLQYVKDAYRGGSVIAGILGERPEYFFFRPPGWEINERAFNQINKQFIVQLLDGKKFLKPPFFLSGVSGNGGVADGELILRTRMLRDVNTADYEMIAWAKKEPSRVSSVMFSAWMKNQLLFNLSTAEMLSWHHRYKNNSREAMAELLVFRTKTVFHGREKGNVTTHIVVFHEDMISLEALRRLVPFWKTSGYEFITLEKAWGL